MDSLMTPTTALLFSELEREAFETPRFLIATNDDIFSQAFMEHNSYSELTSDSFDTSQGASHSFPNRGKHTPPSSTGIPRATHSLKQEQAYSERLSLDSGYYSRPSEPSRLGDIYQIADRSSGGEHLQGRSKEDYTQFGKQIEKRFKSARDLAHQAKGQRADGAYTLAAPLSTSRAPEFEISPLSEKFPMLPADDAKKLPRRHRKRRQLGTAERAIKRETFLERNRVAASKCRSRKKGMVGKLEEDVRMGHERNEELKVQRNELLEEVQILKIVAARCAAEDRKFGDVGSRERVGND